MFGHDFQITRHVTYHVKEYSCRSCKKRLTTSSCGGLTELTPKFKEINDVLERIHYKRLMKTNKVNLNNNFNRPLLELA